MPSAGSYDLNSLPPSPRILSATLSEQIDNRLIIILSQLFYGEKRRLVVKIPQNIALSANNYKSGSWKNLQVINSFEIYSAETASYKVVITVVAFDFWVQI